MQEQIEETVRIRAKPLDVTQPGSIVAHARILRVMIDLEDSQKPPVNPRLQVEAIERAFDLFRKYCEVEPGTTVDAEIEKLNVEQFKELLTAILGAPSVPLENVTPLNGGRKARGRRRTG